MRRGLQRGGVTGGPRWRKSGLLSTKDLLRWAGQRQPRVCLICSRQNENNVAVSYFLSQFSAQGVTPVWVSQLYKKKK